MSTHITTPAFDPSLIHLSFDQFEPFTLSLFEQVDGHIKPSSSSSRDAAFPSTGHYSRWGHPGSLHSTAIPMKETWPGIMYWPILGPSQSCLFVPVAAFSGYLKETQLNGPSPVCLTEVFFSLNLLLLCYYMGSHRAQSKGHCCFHIFIFLNSTKPAGSVCQPLGSQTSEDVWHQQTLATW